MGKLVLAVSMSLDGFIAGPNHSVENGMGEGGDRLHDWMFQSEGTALPNRSASEIDGRQSFKSDTINADVMQDYFDSTGAFLMGRRWFDHGEGPWGKNPPFNVPVFVVTHRKREKLVKGKTSFTFVTDGLQAAVREAKAAAGEKNITTGGSDIPRQLLQAGLLDEMLLSIVPVLLGRGIPLFDKAMRKHIELEKISVIDAPGVTHIRYKVLK
jgi:dihydrofolate reductase